MHASIGLSKATLLLGLCAAGLAHGMDSNFEKRMAADPHGVVEISNVAGSIKVLAWDNPEVEVRAEVGGGVDRIDTTSEHGRVSIKVILPKHSFSGNSATLHVRVPRDSELDISGVSAEVTTSDVEGALQLKTISGGIKADVFQKNTEIKTVSGDVVLRGRGKDAGAAGIHVSTISGGIRIDRAGGDDVHADLQRDVDDRPGRRPACGGAEAVGGVGVGHQGHRVVVRRNARQGQRNTRDILASAVSIGRTISIFENARGRKLDGKCRPKQST